MEYLLNDLRHAVRSLRRRPGFVLVATLSVAIGIGVTTALFSLANAVLLRPVPGVGDPDRVVELNVVSPSGSFTNFSYPDFRDLRRADTPLAGLAGWTNEPMSMNVGGAGVRVQAMYVSANYFDVLAVPAARGRTFLPEEDEGLGQHPVAVLSHRFWRDELGADPDVVGTPLELNRQRYTVVGVTPEGFRGHMALLSVDLWVPLVQFDNLAPPGGWAERRGTSWLTVLGRLEAGATVGQADAAARQVFQRLAEEYPETNADRGVRVDPFGPMLVEARRALGAVMGVMTLLVGLVLTVICTNVAGMMMARSATRQREIAIRLALGSGRRRLVQLLLLEAMVLFGAGGAAGILLAHQSMSALSLASLPLPVEIELDFAPDPWVLGIAVLLTIGTGVLFGLVPALRSSRPDLIPELKSGDAGGRRAGFLYRASVAGQVAVSALLLVVAGLFLRSLQEIGRADPGFQTDGGYVSSLDLGLEGIDDPARGMVLADRIVAELESTPGITGAALASELPQDTRTIRTEVIPEDRIGQEDPAVPTQIASVSEGFFDTLGIARIRGRGFRTTDRADSPRVAIVNQAFARRVWPGRDPLGRRLRFGSEDDAGSVTVVGVVGNAREEWLSTQPEPHVYLPLRQSFSRSLGVVARAAGGLEMATPSMRRALLRADPNLSMVPVMTLEEMASLNTLPQRLAVWLGGGLGVLALFLSAVGVYGVLAFAVVQRTREIGLRMALGASRGRVLKEMEVRALALVVPGLVIGASLALPLGFASRAVLYGVSPLDPAVLAGVLSLLTAVIVAASFVPARRASRVDPMEALRHE